MKKMCIIKTITGSVNLRKQSAKAHIFHTPRKGGKGGREVFLDKAATNAVTGEEGGVVQRSGRANFGESIPGTNPEIGGRIITQSFNVAEGEILKVFVNVRRAYGKLPRSASIFLRVRAKAAYRRMRFNLLEHADTVFTHAEIEGCLDILTTDEAIAAGVHIPTAYRSFSDPSNIATVLEEDVIIREEEEKAVRLEEKTLTDSEGNTRTIRTRKRRRILG